MNADAYRDRDDTGRYPYRLRINGQVARNERGEVRKFATLKAACAYAARLGGAA